MSEHLSIKKNSRKYGPSFILFGNKKLPKNIICINSVKFSVSWEFGRVGY